MDSSIWELLISDEAERQFRGQFLIRFIGFTNIYQGLDLGPTSTLLSFPDECMVQSKVLWDNG